MRHHGEFKVPGGKLVVVDFDLIGGRLMNARVTGDFFLFPDEAIHVINTAMGGATPGEVADRVRAALPPGCELLGFGPDDIAEAVRRALT